MIILAANVMGQRQTRSNISLLTYQGVEELNGKQNIIQISIYAISAVLVIERKKDHSVGLNLK
jgi:hypothetical protein